MIYEKEFTRIKEIYRQLSPAAQEIAGLMALLPVASVALYGGLLGAFGIIGFGTVAALGLVATAAAAAGIACTVDVERELRPWLQRQKDRADARALEKGIALKKRAARYMAEKFSVRFSRVAGAAREGDALPQASAPVVIRLSGAAFNPVALRMLSVANSDVAGKPAVKGPAKTEIARTEKATAGKSKGSTAK
jgi:hypothetical protein